MNNKTKNKILTYLLMTMLFSMTFIVLVAFPARVKATVLGTSGWEDSGGSDDTDNGFWTSSEGNSPTISSSIKHDGSYALKCDPAINNQADMVKSGLSSSAIMYHAEWIYIDDGATGEGQFLDFNGIAYADWQNALFATYYYGGKWGLHSYVSGVATQYTNTSENEANPDNWYWAAICRDVTNDRVLLWVDGILRLNESQDISGNNNIAFSGIDFINYAGETMYVDESTIATDDSIVTPPEVPDTSPPAFGTISANTTLAGNATRISCVITDATAVDFWGVAHNNTGQTTNVTMVDVNSSPISAYLDLTWNATMGNKIWFQFWANDTGSYSAYSSIQTFTLTEQNDIISYYAGSYFTIGQYSNGDYWQIDANSNVHLDSSGYASNLLNYAIENASNVGDATNTMKLIYIQDGNYRLDETIQAHSWVNLTCASLNVVIYQDDPVTYANCITLIWTSWSITAEFDNFALHGGTWDGNTTLASHRGQSSWISYMKSMCGFLVDYISGENLTVQDALFQNIIAQGIDIASQANVYIYNCTVLYAGDNPITLEATTWANATIEKCTVIGGQDVGINTWNTAGVVIKNCVVQNVDEYAGASHWGIAAEQSTYVQITSNIVSGCAQNIVADVSDYIDIEENIVSDANPNIEVKTGSNFFVRANDFTDAGGTKFSETDAINVTLQANIELDGYYGLTLSTVGDGTIGWNQNDDSITVQTTFGAWQFASGTVNIIWTPNGENDRIDFEVDGSNRSTITSPQTVSMSADHNAVAYFSEDETPSVLPSLNVNWMWQYLIEGDFAGFFNVVLATTFTSYAIGIAIITMIFLVALYLRTGSLLLMCIAWLLIGGFLIVVIPIVSGLAIVFMVLGIGGLIYKLFRPSGS